MRDPSGPTGRSKTAPPKRNSRKSFGVAARFIVSVSPPISNELKAVEENVCNGPIACEPRLSMSTPVHRRQVSRCTVSRNRPLSSPISSIVTSVARTPGVSLTSRSERSRVASLSGPSAMTGSTRRLAPKRSTPSPFRTMSSFRPSSTLTRSRPLWTSCGTRIARLRVNPRSW